MTLNEQNHAVVSGKPEEPSLASQIGSFMGHLYDDLFGVPQAAIAATPAMQMAGTYTGHLKKGGEFTLVLRRVGTQILGSYLAPSGHRYSVEGRATGPGGFSVNTRSDLVHVQISGTFQAGTLSGRIVNPKHRYASSYTAHKHPAAAKTPAPKAQAPKTQARARPADAAQPNPGTGSKTVLKTASRPASKQTSGTVQAAPGRAPGPEEFKVLSAQYPDASFTVRRNAAGVATKQERHRVFALIVTAARALGEPFPEVLAAQWALESAWGQSPSGKNNLFGIKARRGEPSTQVVTHEQDGAGTASKVTAGFRNYDSVLEGIRARVTLTSSNPSYARHGYFQATTSREALEALKTAGYATDRDYVAKLVSFMLSMGINPDLPVQAAAGKPVQVLEVRHPAQAATPAAATPAAAAPAAAAETPADLKTLMSKSVLTPEEIATARDMIEQLQDIEQRHGLYLTLQGKVPYHNQRNNASQEGGHAIGDSMCNLTSLAMALETLGIANPEPKHFPQFEDYLEALRVQNRLPARTSMDGWGGVAHAMGVRYQIVGGDVKKGQSGQYGKEWWETHVLPALGQGHAATMSIGGHIVRIQGVSENGLMVDDPYGLSRLDAGKGRGWRGANKKTGAADAETKGAVGANLLWKWDEVSRHTMHWIAILSKQG